MNYKDIIEKAYLTGVSLPGERLNILSTEQAPFDKSNVDIIHREWKPTSLDTFFRYNTLGRKKEY